MTYVNLGNALRFRGLSDRAEDLERVIVAYQAAIDGAEKIGLPEFDRSVYSNLATLHYEREEWPSAYTNYCAAVALLEKTRAGYFSEEAKTTLAENTATLYAQMIDTCLHLGRVQEALERAEAGKGRLFLDQISTGAFPAPPVPSTQQPLLRDESGLIDELRALDDVIRNVSDVVQHRQLLSNRGEKWAALNKTWTQLEPYVPDYVALRRGESISYSQIQALVDGMGLVSALVEFYVLPDKLLAFALRSGEKEPLVIQVPVSQERLQHCVDTYRREVTQYPRHDDIGQRWQELAGPLLTGVLPHLEGAELVYLVPHGLLHYLPLHALRVDGDCLIDRFPITYAPSAAVLNRVIQRQARVEETDDGHRALVLGYTPNEDEREVFEGEAIQVAQHLGTEARLGQEATGVLIREEGPQYETLHLSCHGFFHPTDPLASGLILADGVLTARDIMGLKLNADLVTLSACETALSDQRPGDELVGLTRALLYVGASSVLVTLWSVDAVVARALTGDFYSRLRGQDGAKVKTEAVALREAMLEMRKEKEHPYYWSPFILVGDWR